MKKSDFNFDLPKELIAQTPLADRSSSRLLLLDRRTGKTRHSRFCELTKELRCGDCLVLNDTKVIPARLIGTGRRSGSPVELLLLKRITAEKWEVLVRPGKRARTGDEIIFGEKLSAVIEEVLDNGNRIVAFSYEGIFEEILNELGEMPLPPYITEKLTDAERYQTVYAANQGSAAAPTAGLHFTKEMLDAVRESGVDIAYLTLHVGLGTFRPVKAENIDEHVMHSEYFSLEHTQADVINKCKKNGRVIAVGTTSCRTLESCALPDGTLEARSGYTDIFITPGYEFKVIDGLITNFHLPESTLIMLVSALAGRENVLRAYDEAVRMCYRFFSFGDAMMIADFDRLG